MSSDYKVAIVIGRQHAVAVDDDVCGGPADRYRAQQNHHPNDCRRNKMFTLKPNQRLFDIR